MQQQTQPASAVVIVVEGLGTGLVGAYGSSMAITPALDRMASRGVLLDQCFVDSQQLSTQLRSLWTASHALQASAFPWNLWKSCVESWAKSAGSTANRGGPVAAARLLTDSPEVAELAGEMGCPQVILIEPAATGQATLEPAVDSSQCAVMELLATAASELAAGPPGLVWIHSRGLRHLWDAPLALRAQFADPEDPAPPATVDLPSVDIDADTDPDFVVGWGQVAAAQAAVIDEGLSALRETVRQRTDAENWSWLFTTLGGVPLGEHGRLGWGRSELVGAELHTATIVVPAPALPVGLRRPELFQLPDIGATIARLLELELPDSAWGCNVLDLGAAQSPDRWPHEFRLAMIVDAVRSWLRSPAWSTVLEHSSGDEQTELLGDQLFVKPEDRWEISQIADRRRDIVRQHRQLAPLFIAAAQSGQRSQLPSLDDDLLNLLR